MRSEQKYVQRTDDTTGSLVGWMIVAIGRDGSILCQSPSGKRRRYQIECHLTDNARTDDTSDAVVMREIDRQHGEPWYDASKPDDYPEWLAGFESWLRNRYASLVFAYNDSGMGIHKRLVDEVKEIMEKLHAAMPNSYVERPASRGTEHEFQPLLLKCQTIRKLAYEAKSIAAEIVGASAQQELMEIERLADVVVARILDESGASCDRSLFAGSNEVSRLPPWESA